MVRNENKKIPGLRLRGSGRAAFLADEFFYCLLTCEPASVMLPFTRSV